MQSVRGGAALAVILLAGVSHAAFAAEASSSVDPIVVVGSTPLSETIDPNSVAAPVQTATSEQIDRSNALDLSSFLNRSFEGVYVNDLQNNPLQPDINYRGFTASPLLGTAQGLSLYMDGVRLNQPFGDVVSWDLIPRIAITSVTLVPSSNPLFGLNSLGGALSLRTKTGLTDKGLGIRGSYGSYDRRQAEAEIGGKIAGALHGYLAGSVFGDNGWRVGSPSDLNQAFGKLGWSNANTEVSLTAAYANSNLFGNGLQDKQLLARDYRSVYTQPDQTRNRSALVNLTAEHEFSDTFHFTGNVYGRTVRTRTLNGDVNDAALGEAILQPSAAEQTALRNAGYVGFPTAGETVANTPFPSWRCIANALINSEPNEKCSGLLNRSRTNQEEYGGSGQFTLTAPLGDRPNSLTFGGAYLSTKVNFGQTSQFGYITADRGVTAVNGRGAFADGSQDSENAFDSRVDLYGRTKIGSLYATDTLAVTPQLNLTLSGRWDRTTVRNRDRITPGGGTGSLDGNHTFSRFNPSASATYNLVEGVTAYAGFAQASRAPSSIELGCADPDSPCRLPNSMAGDPPLQQVRTRTIDLGFRGKLNDTLSWRLGVFRANSHDDILFVADDTAGFGYFKNFGQTRREGVEAGFDAQFGKIRLNGSYNYLRATYRSEETVSGAANSTNEAGPGFEGEIDIDKGDRIPLIPAHVFKAGVEWRPVDAFGVNLQALGMSGVYARGNENNDHKPDGVYYLGPGKTPAYVIFNLGADYTFGKRMTLFVQVDNLLDQRYYNSAQLGATVFNAAGQVDARPFAGPIVGGERPLRNTTFYGAGAPRIVRVGFRFALN
jgi:outer membrane receptor protein involved in Fe transport